MYLGYVQTTHGVTIHKRRVKAVPSGQSGESVAHLQLPAWGNADKCLCPLVRPYLNMPLHMVRRLYFRGLEPAHMCFWSCLEERGAPQVTGLGCTAWSRVHISPSPLDLDKQMPLRRALPGQSTLINIACSTACHVTYTLSFRMPISAAPCCTYHSACQYTAFLLCMQLCNKRNAVLTKASLMATLIFVFYLILI